MAIDTTDSSVGTLIGLVNAKDHVMVIAWSKEDAEDVPGGFLLLPQFLTKGLDLEDAEAAEGVAILLRQIANQVEGGG